MILVGFDGGPLRGVDHFFGKHPKPLRDNSPYSTFCKNFDHMAQQLKTLGVEVVNTSLGSHIRAFKKIALAQALDA